MGRELLTCYAVRNVTVRPFIQISSNDLMDDGEVVVFWDGKRVARSGSEFGCVVVHIGDTYYNRCDIELRLVDLVRLGVCG